MQLKSLPRNRKHARSSRARRQSRNQRLQIPRTEYTNKAWMTVNQASSVPNRHRKLGLRCNGIVALTPIRYGMYGIQIQTSVHGFGLFSSLHLHSFKSPTRTRHYNITECLPFKCSGIRTGTATLPDRHGLTSGFQHLQTDLN